MDYKQKYFKYKQKYLRLLKDQKGGEPFLMDILASQVFLYLFERNQRQLQLIYTRRQSTLIQPLENFTLNPEYRLKLLSLSNLSIVLATRLVQGEIKLALQLANRIISRTHKLPEISPPTTLDSSNGGHSETIKSIACHPTLPFFVTGSETIKLWHLVYTSNGLAANCVETLDGSNGGHSNDVNSVALHPTLPFLATGSQDQTAKLWRLSVNLSKATCVATLTDGLEDSHDSIFSIAFHPNPKELLLATGCLKGILRLWLVYPDNSYRCVAVLKYHTYVIFSIAFHPTLPLFATGSGDNTVNLWRLSDTLLRATLVKSLNDSNQGQGHSYFVRSVAFHPTLPLLATGSWDNTVKLWHFSPNGSTAICVSTLDRDNGGHSQAINSVAFHPTLPLLATGSADNTIKLWHLMYTPDGSISAATCVATLAGHSSDVNSVAFHPTLPLLATGSNDKTTKLWKM